MTEYGLALAFDSDDPEFMRGVEVGLVWACLQSEPAEPVVAQVHAANIEMMLRMSDATHRPIRSEDVNDDWMVVTFGAPHE